LKPKVQVLLNIPMDDPFQSSPHFEKLVGNLQGIYSRHIKIQRRLIYAVDPAKKIVRLLPNKNQSFSR